ncbi:hypothetical protein [Rhodococcus sp. IEGM 1305]|uniref:hypothetical protein n=1 Tax=Rhodococcus sp. IEGM 1305 TaxID=3047092 RepID=UPI0024B828AA|nr:hypothetical protein [Rhodococcus sp. IEGM 1305]MDI9950407.1 hypothetical protein [Rhodococcus sp. IEGM 1305]
MSEPRLLLIGRRQSTLDVLKEELTRFGRDVVASNDRELIRQALLDGNVDLVVIGGGLDDPARDAMRDFVLGVKPDVPVHLLPRTAGASPASVIPFANEQIVLFKVHAAAGDEDAQSD